MQNKDAKCHFIPPSVTTAIYWPHFIYVYTHAHTHAHAHTCAHLYKITYFLKSRNNIMYTILKSGFFL